MTAEIEKPDGTYEKREMGDPECGKDFCDGCGDCLHCYLHGPEDYCNGGGSSRWVIYLENEKSPYCGHKRSSSPL